MLMFKPDEPPPPGVHACKENCRKWRHVFPRIEKGRRRPLDHGSAVQRNRSPHKVSDSNLSVIDGPFAEAKEMIASIVIVQVDSKPQAVNSPSDSSPLPAAVSATSARSSNPPSRQPDDVPERSILLMIQRLPTDLLSYYCFSDQEIVMQIQPYLFFEGRCEEAVPFYRKTLGTKVE